MPQFDGEDRTRILGFVLQTLGLLLLSVVVQVLLFSPLQHHRAQHIAYNDLRYALANGTSPVGQLTTSDRLITPGTPIGVIHIPKLGLDEVFLSGTTSDILQSGPGHRRDTVLPGQLGASVVMGRQATFGGPFRKIGTLAIGDEITVTTGQGTAIYTIAGFRRAGDPLPASLGAGRGRLTLVTASGTPYLPTGVLRVDADLTSEAFPTPRSVISTAELSDDEQAFASDQAAWPWVIIWLAVWAGVVAVVIWLRNWWGRAQAYLVGAPVFVLISYLLTQSLFAVLPNLI
ncbi:sortase [Rarobacter faecitabidus]